MHERAAARAQQQDQAFQAYVQQAAAPAATADELAKLADLKTSGAITEDEFEEAKAKALGWGPKLGPASGDPKYHCILDQTVTTRWILGCMWRQEKEK